MKNRDSTIDIAKGICIFLMVLGHTYFYSWFNDRVYLFHMPFFFFVSGFFFSSKNKAKDFVANKTKRLLVPMFVYWTCNYFLTLPISLWSGTIAFSQIGALWFLLSLWTIFLLTYFITHVIESLWGRMIVALAVLAIAYSLNNRQVMLPFHFVQSLFMYPMFLLGTMFYQVPVNSSKQTLYQLLFSKNNNVYLFFGILGIIMLIFVRFDYLNVENLKVPNPLSLFLGAFSGIFMVLAISKVINEQWPKFAVLLCNLGKASLHVLGFHFAILELLYFVGIATIIRLERFGSFGVDTGEEIKQNMPILALIFSLIATCISYYIGIICEKKCPALWGKKKMKYDK